MPSRHTGSASRICKQEYQGPDVRCIGPLLFTVRVWKLELPVTVDVALVCIDLPGHDIFDFDNLTGLA